MFFLLGSGGVCVSNSCALAILTGLILGNIIGYLLTRWAMKGSFREVGALNKDKIICLG